MATYLLLDGHSLAYRAWFALQETGMRTASGQETQAVYGFVSMLTRLLDDVVPDGMAVAFDRVEPTFRDEISPDYKAGRATTPTPLVEQLGLIRQFVEALGVPAVDVVGYEADDVIGTLAKRVAAAGDDVIIVTGDRDTYQLVADPHVKVLYNRRGVTDYVLYDEAGIIERTGVKPTDYPLLAALRGDPSDNLPGVPGVGEKTAARLVNDYGDIKGIFANLASLTPKLRQSLAAAEAQVRQNLALTPIVCDVEIELEPQELAFKEFDTEGLDRLFDFLEMKTLKERLAVVLKKLGSPTSLQAFGEEQALVTGAPVLVLESIEAVQSFCAAIKDDQELALEPSYQALPGRSAIEALALFVPGAEQVAVIPGELLGEEQVLAALGVLLADDPLAGQNTRRRLIAHRAKELMRSLLPDGLDITTLDVDTAVLAYLVDPTEGAGNLEELAGRRGIALSADAPVLGTVQLGFDLGEEAGLDLLRSTAQRAEVLEALSAKLSEELAAVGGVALWEEIERPLVRVLAKMEVAGIAVDVKRLSAIASELTEEARQLEKLVYEQAGEVFNINSPPQLRVVLYEKLGLKPQRRTKTGFSTDAQTLERLREEHPMIETMLKYREVEKLRSTYGSGLLAEVGPDGRIHASFNQTVARTGRLSSDAPNLHNIPVRTDGGRRFREAFIPVAGCALLVADYNQIELRVIAHLSDDPGLVEAFATGRDIHATTAAGIFDVEIDKVSAQMRAKAKMVSYGLAYGMEAYGLSQRLQIGVEEAAEILNQYFVAFPSVRAYMDATVQQARFRGYTETERGRRRYLPELAASNFRVRQAAERQAMNAGIQGLAADIFKIALVRLDAALEQAGFAARLVLQVHDEVLLEVPVAELAEVRMLTIETMRNAYPLKVPLEVHVASGTSWADAKQD